MYPTKDVPKQSPLFAFCAIDPRWHWGRHHACTQSPQSSMHPKSVLFMGTYALTAMIATFSPVTYSRDAERARRGRDGDERRSARAKRRRVTERWAQVGRAVAMEGGAMVQGAIMDVARWEGEVEDDE